MSWANEERLYHLLPAIYRLRDHDKGEPLRALLSIIQNEVETIEGDIDGLYENWFIETAVEWLIPYIGDLLGARHLHTIDSAGVYSLRAYVANTLRYRQGKGTPAVLEQLADDITGWDARVVEFFQLLGTTQHLNHLRPQNRRTPDLRRTNRLELLDSPFDTIAHTAEVRRIRTRQGRYTIPHVGLFLWRLQSYPIKRITPRPAGGGRFRLNPQGVDAPLFNRPEAEPSIRHIATERNVPQAIRRREMVANKNAYVGESEPAAEFFIDGTQLAADQIKVCHLGEWDEPGWKPPAADGAEKVAVDPVSGRFVILPGTPVPAEGSIEVSTTYGFSGDLGGGPYHRNETIERSLAGKWTGRVNQAGGGDFATLQAAITAWNTAAGGAAGGLVGIIAVTDNLTYAEDLTGGDAIQIPEKCRLLLTASQPFDSTDTHLDADGSRAHLNGNLSVVGTASASSADPGGLTIDGLLIEGGVRLRQGNLGALNLTHTTVQPQAEALTAPSKSNRRLHIALYRTICGGIRCSDTVPEVTVTESIVDALAGEDIVASGAAVTIHRSTVFGADDVFTAPAMRQLEASESIFMGRLNVERRQQGCVRFCYLPDESRTPRRYRCQPDLALAGVTDPAARKAIRHRLRPDFTSIVYGDPGYAQLTRACGIAIRTGAENGSEMGAFYILKQPQRESNLLAAVEEYLPFGLEAGLFYVN